MPNRPLVSVYVPTRGRPDLVGRAVASALAQSYRRLELIVVVDGEDAKTERVLRELAIDPRLRIEVLKQSGGACRARNHAIFCAQGEFITGLDDDDELLPQHVDILRSSLMESCRAYSCTTAILRRADADVVRHRFAGEVSLAQLCRQNVVGNQVFTRTQFLRQLGGFDPGMPAWQDYDLWMRLTERFGSGTRIDARTYVQHLDHEHERISDPTRIESAYRRFVEKHSHLLDERARDSLELLKFATTHQPFSFRKAARFVRSGFAKRTMSALISDRFPALRGPTHRVQSLFAGKKL